MFLRAVSRYSGQLRRRRQLTSRVTDRQECKLADRISLSFRGPCRGAAPYSVYPAKNISIFQRAILRRQRHPIEALNGPTRSGPRSSTIFFASVRNSRPSCWQKELIMDLGIEEVRERGSVATRRLRLQKRPKERTRQRDTGREENKKGEGEQNDEEEEEEGEGEEVAGRCKRIT